MIRAVLDANVLISAIISGLGPPAQILAAWRSEQIQPVLSIAILKEIDRVLRYPRIARYHRWSEDRIKMFIEDLAGLASLTPGMLNLSVIEEDPSDNRYLECAVEGKAAYIVTGDQHLLSLETYQGIQILNPRAFLRVLEGQN